MSLQEVDAVTAECLALREQVGIYEEQLANMEAQHKSVRKQRFDEAGTVYSSKECLEIYLVQTGVVKKRQYSFLKHLLLKQLVFNDVQWS